MKELDGAGPKSGGGDADDEEGDLDVSGATRVKLVGSFCFIALIVEDLEPFFFFFFPHTDHQLSETVPLEKPVSSFLMPLVNSLSNTSLPFLRITPLGRSTATRTFCCTCGIQLARKNTIVSAVICPLISALSYPGADIVLLCFSTVSQASYDAIREKWYPEVNHYIPDVPSLLVGTKMDMRESDKDNSDNVSKAQGEKLAKEIESEEYLECSAKTTQGLAAIFNRAVDIVLTVFYD